MTTRWERRDEREREKWKKKRGGKKLGLNRKIRLISCSVDYNTQWSLVISILRCRTEETKFIITRCMEYLKILLHNISFSLCDCFWICPEKKISTWLSKKKNIFFLPPSMKVPRFVLLRPRQWSRNIELDLTHLLINVQVYPTVSIVKLKRGFIRL